MSDRELLLLAAKAAGIEVWPRAGMLITQQTGYWDPLTSDGDALRLAVRLQLSVYNEQVQSGAAYCTRGDDEVFQYVSGATNGGSKVLLEDYAATRRAIVLAAAKIGKSMP